MWAPKKCARRCCEGPEPTPPPVRFVGSSAGLEETNGGMDATTGANIGAGCRRALAQRTPGHHQDGAGEGDGGGHGSPPRRWESEPRGGGYPRMAGPNPRGPKEVVSAGNTPSGGGPGFGGLVPGGFGGAPKNAFQGDCGRHSAFNNGQGRAGPTRVVAVPQSLGGGLLNPIHLPVGRRPQSLRQGFL